MKVLDLYRKKGCKVMRLNSESPKLFIFGEDHNFLNNIVSPKKLFCELRPKYFFCESVRSGLEMDYSQHNAIREDPNRQIPRESFEELIKITINAEFCSGFAGQAITKWFDENPGTTFVGIDLPGKGDLGGVIAQKMDAVVEKLDGDLAELLGGSRELSDEQYVACNKLRDFLYKYQDTEFNHAYEGMMGLKGIMCNFPRTLPKGLHIKKLVSQLEKETNGYNTKREIVMARTMVKYVSASDAPCIAVVGNGHIIKNSHLYPILDRSGIKYAAINIMK
jgi:hypothetical protein